MNMKANLFIYGVPLGADAWKTEDKDYFITFYNDMCSDKVKLLIQIRKSNGKLYCYYNYLVYENVVDYNRREGSYFGISFRIDAYCKDIANMYRILDYIYNAYILGRVLKIDGTSLKYVIPDFASISKQLEDMEQVTMQMVKNTFSEESFERLSEFSLSSGKCYKYNLYDCMADNILDIVQKYGEIAISPYYPSLKEITMQQQYASQLQKTQHEFDVKLKANSDAYDKEKKKMQNTLSGIQTRVSQLENQVSQKDVNIRQLNTEVSQLQTKIKNLGKLKEISQLIEPIKQPIVELAQAFKEMTPTDQQTMADEKDVEGRGKPKTRRWVSLTKTLFSYVNFILLIMILTLIVFPFKKGDENNTDYVELTEKIKSLESENQELQDQLVAQKTEIDNLSIPEDFNINDVKIDIPEYNGKGNLKKGTEYTVNAENGVANSTWEVSGCEMKRTSDPNTIKIIPNESSVTITYKVLGNYNKQRKFDVK